MIWTDLEARLEVSTQDEEVKRPTPEDLDGFEAEFGFRLPDDYRDYALTFGPGELGRHEFGFCTPGFPRANRLDLAKTNREWHDDTLARSDDKTLTRRFGDAGRARRFVLFGYTAGIGDRFAWDPAGVTDAERHEYGIYIIPEGGNASSVVRVAASFREFVMDYALGDGYERQFDDYLASEPTERDGTGPIQFGQPSLDPA
jgi:SMI1 / KNR4 family (SUKH-1)